MTNTALHQIILLLCLLIVLVLVHNVASTLACLACRVKVERFALFYGKPLAVFQTPLCPIAVGFLPFGGYVSFDIEQFAEKPLVARWFVVASGPLALLATSGVFLPFNVAAMHFANGFAEIVRGTFAPFEHGVPLIQAFFRITADSTSVGCGILATKWAAVSFFPLPGQAGSRVLIEIPSERHKSKFARVLTWMAFPLAMLMFICWMTALVSYFKHL